MTTDEVQQTSVHKKTAIDNDEFSSEDYTEPYDPGRAVEETGTEMVILGAVTGEVTIGADPRVSTVEPDAAAETGSGSIDTATDDPTDENSDSAASTPIDAASETTDSPTAGEAAYPDTASSGVTTAIDDEEGGDDQEEDDDPSSERSHLEMRQVAGLTAGSMMKLTMGRAFEFNESNDGGSFSLRVLENGEVVVHPGSARAVIDEVEVTEPMLVGDALLNVSSACFSVRRPRPPASSKSRMESIGAAFASISAVHVPPLGAEEPMVPEQLMGSRLGTIINRNPLTRGSVGHDAWTFLQAIRQTRSVVAERHRLMHPDPEELKTRLSRLDPGLWERSRDHSLFGRFGIGYANIPWEPRFDNPELIPEMLHEPIVEMSLLPWVPVTANLLYGPLGIVGKRAARLAACRHAILSLAALSMPGEIRFAIRSGKNTATSWNWTRALPPIMSDYDDSPYVVTVIDGADGARVDEATRRAAFEEAVGGSDDHPAPDDPDASDADDGDGAVDPTPTTEVPVVKTDDDFEVVDSIEGHAPGYIVLADSTEELTQPCGTVLQIEPDGTGSVTNHLNETIQVTPIGVTEAFAHDMATRIADILTNSFL